MTARMSLPLYTVDAFTDAPFLGNPAAVVLLDQGAQSLEDERLQQIAAEMNLSETAYIKCLSSEDSFATASRFGLRWFTPTCEVNLCGHATLASSAALFRCAGNSNSSITFETKSGDLVVKKDGEWLCMDFPLNPPEDIAVTEVENVLQVVRDATGVSEADVQFSKATRKLVICLPDSFSRVQLESMALESKSLQAAQPTGSVRGVIVTTSGDADDGGYDFISRYFAPWVGIPEDPVTGSAHTVLGAYWMKKLGKSKLKARQCSARGGDVMLSIRDDGRIDIAGRAAVVVRGTITI